MPGTCILAACDVERHGADGPVADHGEERGSTGHGRVLEGGRATGKSSFRGCGCEAGPHDGDDALRSFVSQQRLDQAAGAVGDRGGVVGEQCHQPFGAARGGRGVEFLDDPAGGCRVGFAAARGGDAVPCPVEVLPARGLDDVKDLGVAARSVSGGTAIRRWKFLLPVLPKAAQAFWRRYGSSSRTTSTPPTGPANSLPSAPGTSRDARPISAKATVRVQAVRSGDGSCRRELPDRPNCTCPSLRAPRSQSGTAWWEPGADPVQSWT